MPQSVEDLIASYMSQSPLAFAAMAIVTDEDEHVVDRNKPKMADDENEHGAVNATAAAPTGAPASLPHSTSPAGEDSSSPVSAAATAPTDSADSTPTGPFERKDRF